jgi:hypothetical protein
MLNRAAPATKPPAGKLKPFNMMQVEDHIIRLLMRAQKHAAASKYINKLRALSIKGYDSQGRRDCESWWIQFAARWPETRLRPKVYTFGKTIAFKMSTECRIT